MKISMVKLVCIIFLIFSILVKKTLLSYNFLAFGQRGLIIFSNNKEFYVIIRCFRGYNSMMNKIITEIGLRSFSRSEIMTYLREHEFEHRLYCIDKKIV
jgi:hypothetical protein